MTKQLDLFSLDLSKTQKNNSNPLPDSKSSREQVLAAEIHKHNILYNEGRPEISDAEFDRLTEELRKINPNHPELKSMTSPVVATSSGRRVQHPVPMLSLGKAYDLKTVVDFFINLQTDRSRDFIGSPKIDGLACSLVYDQNGDLIQASTRGDGLAGDNITANVRYIQAIPHHIDMPNLEVRGEVYMPISSFNAFEGVKKSPRNLAVGGLKQKNPQDTALYKLSFFAYDALGRDFPTEHEKYDTLKSLGFTPVSYQHFQYPIHDTYNQLMNMLGVYCNHQTADRPNWDFDADGLVFKLDDTVLQKSLGATDHHPKCAIAFKFAGDKGETVLRSVEWQVGKSGVITPVANFDPVYLSGAMVQRASLSNVSQVENFPTCPSDCPPEEARSPQHLKIGSTIMVSRRGGVIPKVEYMVDFTGDDPNVILPETCPSCGSPVIRDNLFLVCSDPENCASTGQAQIENYLKVVNCLGFGEKIISNLYDAGLIKTPADLYRLTIQDIALAVAQSEDGSIDPSALLPAKLYNAIQNARTLDLATFLEALSIPALGKVKSRDLAKKLPNLNDILNASQQQIFDALDYRKLDSDLGSKFVAKRLEKAPKPNELLEKYLFRVITHKEEYIKYIIQGFDSIHSFFEADAEEIQSVLNQGYAENAANVRSIYNGLKKRAELISDLLQFITVQENPPSELSGTGPFSEMTFLFTGSLESMKREEAQALVESLGGKAATGVSKNLSVLVATSNTSSKWIKAQKLNAQGANIQLWTESDFLAALDKARK